MGPKVVHKVGRQSTLAIGGSEREAQPPDEGLLPREGRDSFPEREGKERLVIEVVLPNPKMKGKSTSPVKFKRQLEVPSFEGVTKKSDVPQKKAKVKSSLKCYLHLHFILFFT